MKFFFLTMAMLVSVSCGQTGSNLESGTSNAASSSGACSCTFTYDPVCGDNKVTYDNACIASQCFGRQFTSGGTCAQLGQCNLNSGFVCGQPPMPPCPQGSFCTQALPAQQTYSNECEMLQAGATLVKTGSCN